MLSRASLGDTRERPFSRSYGAILPSSLTMDHPITLVFSTRLPVSDCGTGTWGLARRFSRQLGSLELGQKPLSLAARGLNERTDLPTPQPTTLEDGIRLET